MLRLFWRIFWLMCNRLRWRIERVEALTLDFLCFAFSKIRFLWKSYEMQQRDGNNQLISKPTCHGIILHSQRSRHYQLQSLDTLAQFDTLWYSSWLVWCKMPDYWLKVLQKWIVVVVGSVLTKFIRFYLKKFRELLK